MEDSCSTSKFRLASGGFGVLVFLLLLLNIYAIFYYYISFPVNTALLIELCIILNSKTFCLVRISFMPT